MNCDQWSIRTLFRSRSRVVGSMVPSNAAPDFLERRFWVARRSAGIAYRIASALPIMRELMKSQRDTAVSRRSNQRSMNLHFSGFQSLKERRIMCELGSKS